MIPGGIRRPTSRWERALAWLAVSLVVTAALVAGGILGIRALQRATAAPASFGLASLLGTVALVASLATLFYSLRKRRLQERLGGTMMVWFKAHLYVGAIAVAAAVAHVLVLSWTPSFSTGNLTAIVFAVLVVSGVVWRIVYREVPPHVAANVGNLARQDTRRRQQQSRLALDRIAAGRSEIFANALRDLLDGAPPDRLEAKVRQLPPEEAEAWREAVEEAGRLERAGRRERRQGAYARRLQSWRLIHLPLAALFLGMVGVHVLDVFGADRTFESEPRRSFASSAECARCHADIVREWRLSMHRNAQTSTITVAQTLVALERNPGFEKACVNCHAPVGSKFSDRAVFPVLEPDPEANPSSVEDEGVSCVVCHSMSRHPGELAGFGDLPLGTRSATSLGTFFGPPLQDPPPIPSAAHSSDVGFMTDGTASSQLCGSCHNVKVDLNNNGLIATEFAASAAGSPDADSDGDGILDANELDVVQGELQDLVLQTTFDEWQNYVAGQAGRGTEAFACVDCHMPSRPAAPVVDSAPLLARSGDRARRAHTFAGVDYDLNAAYYRQPGMPDGALEQVLEEREELLAGAAQVDVEVGSRDRRGRTPATVTVTNLTGHDFPTGFAFARQFFLDVSARTASGREVCLAPDPHGIPSPCASGRIEQADQELATCDPAILRRGNADIRFAAVSPRQNCDPWLANFQKILTDGDPDGDGTFDEVAFQSKLPDIVKLRVRTADQETMAPLPPGESASFDYVFDTSPVGAEPIEVRAVLRFRHLPPSLVKALDGSYNQGLSSAALLPNMTVVDVASNQELGEERTTPKPADLASKTVVQARGLADLAQDLPSDEFEDSVDCCTDPPPPPTTTTTTEPLVASVSLSASPRNYGEALVGTTGRSGSVSVRSTGETGLTVYGVSLDNTSDFTITGDGCSNRELAPGGSCTVQVAFRPKSAGARAARVTVSSSAPSSPDSVNISGTGTVPQGPVAAAALSPNPLSFGEVALGSSSSARQLSVRSAGNAPLTISSIPIRGSNPGDFNRSRDGCSGRTLPPGQSCTVSIVFTPRAAGARSARISVASNASATPEASLAGSGLATVTTTRRLQSPTPRAREAAILIQPDPVDFGSVSVGTATGARTITATSIGDAELRIDSVTIGVPPVTSAFAIAQAPGEAAGQFTLALDECSGATLTNGASCRVDVVFQPAAPGRHSSQALFRTNAPVSERAVALTGEGIAPAAVLEVTPFSSLPGSIIETRGTGCPPGSAVTFTVDGLPVLGQSRARIDGTFQTKIDLPDDLGVGRRRVVATCGPTLEGSVDLVSTTQSATPGGPLAGTLLVSMFFLLRAQSLARRR